MTTSLDAYVVGRIRLRSTFGRGLSDHMTLNLTLRPFITTLCIHSVLVGCWLLMLYFCITVPAAIALFVSFIINIFVVAVFAEVSWQQTLNDQ